MIPAPDHRPALPVYRQIYLRLREAISEGRLLPGERVPSARALAAELNVARGTVDNAYQMLIGEGYLQTRGAAGTVVSVQLSGGLGLGASHRHGVTPAVALPSPMTHGGGPPLPLQLGLPALDAFPRKLWTRLAGQALRHSGLDGLVYPDPRGEGVLRSAVAAYLGVSRGIACRPEQVFIGAGYRACLDLIWCCLLRPGDVGWFEDPGYFQARDFLQQAGARLVPVAVDAQGLDVDAGLREAPDARFAVVTPTHQSPLGVTLTLGRRQRLLEWAEQQGSWIIEDDYDSEYRYQGRPLPALKSLDRHGRVLYCGTFSKVLAPGLRLAYLVVPPDRVAQFAVMADRMHNHCPALLQATTASFIEQGHFARHLRKMRHLYAQRRLLLADAISAELGDSLVLDLAVGGMHLLGYLREGLNDREIGQRLQAQGLAVEPLSPWYRGTQPRQGLLIGFTNVTGQEQAMHLASRLGQVLQ